jgi:hypothetical protein
MPQQVRRDEDDTAELYEDTVELPATSPPTSPELPVDAQAIVAWRKEASKSFNCGIPQTVTAVDPYATADQRASPARPHRRTLDDMRRMSEQIKRNRTALESQSAAAESPSSSHPNRQAVFWRSALRSTLEAVRRFLKSQHPRR